MPDSTKKSLKSNESKTKPIEVGGFVGLEPTRYGKETPEWEVKGRVSDF